jgi:hypothetical protein
VDFAVLTQRNSTYREAENRSMEEFRQELESSLAGIPDDAGCAQGGRR